MRVMEEGDCVFVDQRPDPNKPGWFAANGVVCKVYDEEGNEPGDENFTEPFEGVIIFDEGDIEHFFCDEFEWTDSYQGTWIKQ